MFGPLCFVVTLWNVMEVTKHANKIFKDEGLGVEVHLIGYADDVNALLVAHTEAVLQMGIDIMSEEFVAYFSCAGLAINLD